MAKGAMNSRRIVVADFIEDVAASARLAANARGITLTVAPVDSAIAIDGDDQILTAVMGNLLQNAIKFTHVDTAVTLRVQAGAERVRLEVEDECGGLPGGGDAQELAAVSEQRGTDRSGLGIGLAFSRWGAEVNGGHLYARDLPGTGCVFILELPRAIVPAPMAA